jgi:hypothetical protein
MQLANGVQAAAKTGTAQLNPPGEPPSSHAWITTFAPADAPRVVVAVMVKASDEVTAGTGGTVAGPGFALRFAGGDGFHLPDALLLDGVDVMGHEAAPGCFDEDEVGFQITPTPRISAHTIAPPELSRLVPVLRGPAVVQLRLDWRTRFACNTARAPGGTSTFTVFPDRIVRHDVLSDARAEELSAGSCECARGDGLFTVATYWTLARTPFTTLYVPEPRTPPSATDPVITNFATACVDDAAHQLAFAWASNEGTRVRGGNAVLGFGRELVFGDSTLRAFDWRDSSAIVLERTGCQVALARASEHAAPSPVVIDGAELRPSPVDGIYGGDDGDDSNGPPGIPVGTARVTLTGAVRSSFAVWLRFRGSVDALRARRDGATGPWYLPQRLDDGSWIVWFRDPVPEGQTIEIEPI